MSRPAKQRYVCCMPRNGEFLPAQAGEEAPVVLTVDEYETIRLIDLEGVTQEECAAQMHVSRTTVQGVYDSARRKIADALVNARGMRIAGGNVVVCKQYGTQCGRGCHGYCHKHSCHKNEKENG